MTRMYSMSIEELPVNTIEQNFRHIIFLVRPELRIMDRIADLVGRYGL